MRTSLYSPIFINPLAYFVFPLLAVLEPKTDNFIEEAIFTGFLLIDPIDESGIKMFANTKQIDLSEFAGKHIRISQYTDNGAVALGEWNLPSISNSYS